MAYNHKLYMRKWYKENQALHVSYVMKSKRSRIKRLREQVNSFKRQPCCDCGKKYHPVVMDFDHSRRKKFKDVSQMVSMGFSISRILAEIDKCDLVCSNCHRLRTWKRRLGIRCGDTKR